MRILIVGVIAAELLGQPAAWVPEQPWPQRSEWAGSRVCAGCHADLYRRQETSNHAKSLRPPSEVRELTQGIPFSRQDRSSGAVLTLEAGPALAVATDSERRTLPLTWAFGSGKKGITPLGRREDGTFVESHLSWYANGGFGITTGAVQRPADSLQESLGRVLTAEQARECFGCHTTAYRPGDAPPARHEMGIRCERCHGPGEEHARVMAADNRAADRKILHPGKLDAASQVQMCGVCHGRPPADSDLAALQRIERSPNTVRFPSQRLVLSRCYNESSSGLACSRCHDPHENVPAEAARHDQACTGCHAKPGAICPKAQSQCASCHMPRQQVMLHSVFTDHFIRIAQPGEARK